MFANTHFYHRTIRRCVVAFGNMFNQIQLIKYEKGTFNEVERITVPIAYASNENYAQRLLGNPELPSAVQIKLPRMSFEMTDIAYDSARKLSSLNEECAVVNGVTKSVPNPTPYDIGFELNIYVINMEDGTQILEQILPYFNPEYTMAMTYIDEMQLSKNVPLVLNSVQHSNEYEGDNQTVRMVTWTLRFTMKAYFYGPVKGNRSIIRQVNANSHIITTSGPLYNAANGQYETVEANTLAYTITVTPDPSNANPDDAYGFDVMITDHVDTESNS